MKFNEINNQFRCMLERLRRASRKFKVPSSNETLGLFERRGREDWAKNFAGKSVDELGDVVYKESYLRLLSGYPRSYYERYYAIITIVCFIQALESYRVWGSLMPELNDFYELYIYFKEKHLDRNRMDIETFEIYSKISKLCSVYLNPKYSELKIGDRTPALDADLRADLGKALE